MSRRAAALAAIIVTLTLGVPSVAGADVLADPTPPAAVVAPVNGILDEDELSDDERARAICADCDPARILEYIFKSRRAS